MSARTDAIFPADPLRRLPAGLAEVVLRAFTAHRSPRRDIGDHGRDRGRRACRWVRRLGNDRSWLLLARGRARWFLRGAVDGLQSMPICFSATPETRPTCSGCHHRHPATTRARGLHGVSVRTGEPQLLEDKDLESRVDKGINRHPQDLPRPPTVLIRNAVLDRHRQANRATAVIHPTEKTPCSWLDHRAEQLT